MKQSHRKEGNTKQHAKDYLHKTKGKNDLPVIVITGRGALMKDMFELEGVREFLQKPFEATQLVEMVKKHVV